MVLRTRDYESQFGSLQSFRQTMDFLSAETRKNLQINGLRTWKVFGLAKAAEGTET